MLDELRGGTTYIVREKKGDAAFELLSKLTSGGRDGLCITRKHPEIAKSHYSIPAHVHIRWLTPSLGKDRMDPKALNALTNIVYRFVTENPGAVVLLDGLEYLLLHNEFSKTLLFLENVNDYVMQSDALLLVPINPEAMQGHDIALIERNAEVLTGEKLASEAKVEKFVGLIDRYLKT